MIILSADRSPGTHLRCALWWRGRPWCSCDLFSRFSQIRWCHYSGRSWEEKQSRCYNLYIVFLQPTTKYHPSGSPTHIQILAFSVSTRHSFYSFGPVSQVACLCNRIVKCTQGNWAITDSACFWLMSMMKRADEETEGKEWSEADNEVRENILTKAYGVNNWVHVIYMGMDTYLTRFVIARISGSFLYGLAFERKTTICSYCNHYNLVWFCSGFICIVTPLQLYKN